MSRSGSAVSRIARSRKGDDDVEARRQRDQPEHHAEADAVGAEQGHHATQVGRAHGRVGRTLRRLVPLHASAAGPRAHVGLLAPPEGDTTARARTAGHPRAVRPRRYRDRVTRRPTLDTTRARRDTSSGWSASRSSPGSSSSPRAEVNVLSMAVCFQLLVLVVSGAYGLVPGPRDRASSSALAFNWFFVPPVYTFTIADTRNWVAPRDLRRDRRHHELPRRRLPPPAARGRGAPARRGAARGDGPDRARARSRRPAGRRGGARGRRAPSACERCAILLGARPEDDGAGAGRRRR